MFDVNTGEYVIDGVAYGATPQDVSNPACLYETVGWNLLGDAGVVDAAVTSAAAAFCRWAAHGAASRAELLRLAADRVQEQVADLAALLTREHGKTLVEAERELESAVGVLRYYASIAYVATEERASHSARGIMIERRVPLGVVAVIVPWNYPVLLALLMVAPALAAGNTAVVKLPDHSPLTLARVLTALSGVFPPGVLNFVAGTGEGVGARLTTHEQVRRVMFTGSTSTGRLIMRQASSTVKSLSLELGGNDPVIVLDSASVDEELVGALVRGAFATSGQVCYAPKRLYVARKLYDPFVEAFAELAGEICVGSGLDPVVTMGPLNNRAQYDRVNSLIDDSRSLGARVQQVGLAAPDTDWENGNFVLPTVVSDIHHDAALVQEEQFGPVVPIMPFDTVEEAVAKANDSEYGLAASVWSRDLEEAETVARRLEAGTVFLNVHAVGASDVSMPFGGFKQSGLGRGHGIVALEDCMEFQVIAERRDMAVRNRR